MGLRQSYRNPINAPGLLVCHNLRPRKEGLESIPTIVNPFEGSLLDWPFPVLYKNMSGTYSLFGREKIYDVDSYWNLTEKFEPSQEPTSRWTPCSFGDFEVAFGGGINLLRKKRILEPWPVMEYSEALLSEIPTCSSGCDLRGQLVICDIQEGQNWVAWSEIGSLSFDVYRSNVAGRRPMPWPGPIWQVLPIEMSRQEGLSASNPRVHNYGVVAYGEKGVGYLQAVDQPAPTFKLDQVLEYGIASRFACGGDKEKHLFIDERGYLREISGGKGVQKLDYLEWLQPLLGSDFVITKDDSENQWWISNGEVGFLYGEGLCTTDYIVADGFSDAGVFVAVHNKPTIEQASFRTDTFDMEVRAKKSLETLVLRAECDGKIDARVWWRNYQDEDFRAGPWVPIVRGLGHPRVSGVDLQVELRFQEYTRIRVHDMAARYKLIDKTNLRGVSNNAYGPANSRAGQL